MIRTFRDSATQMRKKPLKAGLCVSIYKKRLNKSQLFFCVFLLHRNGDEQMIEKPGEEFPIVKSIEEE